MNGIIRDATVGAVWMGTGIALCGNGFLASTRAFGLRIERDRPWFDDVQADTTTAVRAVVRRLRFPATRLVIAPMLTQATPPAAQMRSQQQDDDDQQHDVGKVDVIWHVEIQWNEEILCQMVFMSPMRSSANYQLFVWAVPPDHRDPS
jgi:hypothetical protein